MGDITLVDKFLNEFSEIGKRISREDIDKAIDILIETWKKGNKIFTIGNGGSASTATHFACDLAKSTIETLGSHLSII